MPAFGPSFSYSPLSKESLSAFCYTKSPVSLPVSSSDEYLPLLLDRMESPPHTRPRITLDALPFEIRHLVAQQCLQADAFRLCLTCKSLYQSSVSRLYQCIIFDSSNKHFNKEVRYKRLRPRSDLSSSSYSSAAAPTAIPLSASPCSISTFASDTSMTSTGLEDHDNDDDENEHYFSYTSVHTVGGIRRCIRSLAKDPSKASYIRRFEVLNGVDIPDFEIRQFLERSLPAMRNLAILVWNAAPLLTVDLLEPLTRGPIETLSLNMRFHRASDDHGTTAKLASLVFPHLRKLTIQPFLSSEFLPLVAKMISNSPETMHNLQWLHLGRNGDRASSGDPFFAFASMDPQGVITPAGAGGPVGNALGVMGGRDDVPDRMTRGRAFWNLDSQLDDQCIPAFFSSLRQYVNEAATALSSASTASTFFTNPLSMAMYRYYGSTKLQLSYLGLTGVMVRGHEDFRLLEQCVELATVSRLNLSGVDSYNAAIDGLPPNDSPEGQDSRGRALVPGFLPNMAERLVTLTSLAIDWSENGRDTVPQFLASLPRHHSPDHGLKSLKVVVRWSAPKASVVSWPGLCDQYARAIVGRHAKSLTNLVLDLGFDDTFGTETAAGRAVGFSAAQTVVLGMGAAGTIAVATVPTGGGAGRRGFGVGTVAALSSGCIRQLAGLKELRGLSISSPSMDVIKEVICGLPKLEFLRLRNSHSKPYLGQNTSYLLEDWLRYKHIVEAFWRSQRGVPGAARDEELKSLRFVKLEDYVFELQQQQSEPSHNGDEDAERHSRSSPPRQASPKQQQHLQLDPEVSVILREGLNKWFTTMCEGETILEED